MALDIARNGIVQRHEDGATTIVRPARNGGVGTLVEVPEGLADAYRLVTGDVVGGESKSIDLAAVGGSDEGDPETQPDWDVQIDEPSALRSPGISVAAPPRRRVTERLIRVATINGLTLEVAADRPFPRTKRSQSERTAPDHPVSAALGAGDFTGRTLDFAAPLALGVFGVIYGPHGAGLTRTLQAALMGTMQSAPDCVPIVLLLRPRAEEATEWRRRVPTADIVAASCAHGDGSADETLRICALVLEAAQRQSEIGLDVVLAIDSLTGIWAAMLEGEEADAQHEADKSSSRQGIREWAQRAGCFHGSGPLGGGLGGSLTILGTVWHQAVDEEAEWERDTHPHLRLLEHLLPEASWLVALSQVLKQRRLFPAIDIKRCRSQFEERLLSADIVERWLTVRGGLPRNDPVACHLRVMESLESSADWARVLDKIADLTERAEAESP